MKYIELQQNKVRPLSFYLAMEEFIARNIDESECFFMWQVNPTVILGRNQLIENEVNLDYCRTNHIDLYRRKSGGGCVYADWSNIMFSYITKCHNVHFTFDRYLHMIAHILQKLGINAKASGRNDILINGKKVSGNAFYHLSGKSIVHGTMLYNTNLENLVCAITPSNEKLISKGIKSVRQRVTNLSEYLSIDIEEFKSFVRNQMCNDEILLTSDQIQSIKEIEREYANNDFIFGNNPRYTIIKKGQTSAGELEMQIELKNGLIKHINIIGDYFFLENLDKELITCLRNIPYERNAVYQALKNINLSNIILHLTKDEWLRIMFS